MSNVVATSQTSNQVLVAILQELLENDIDITAREVVRRHPSIAAASTITRSASRTKLLTEYQLKQREFRRWAGRAKTMSKSNLGQALANKDHEIARLRKELDLLIASHVAMIRAVGELGGFLKWRELFSPDGEAFAIVKKLGGLGDEKISA